MSNVWTVSGRYAAAGPRPGNRRHPAPEDFRRRSVVGPAGIATVETVFDLLEIPEGVRVSICKDAVTRAFVEGKLVPDATYPHRVLGMGYVSRDPAAQLVEWSIEFTFITKVIASDV